MDDVNFNQNPSSSSPNATDPVNSQSQAKPKSYPPVGLKIFLMLCALFLVIPVIAVVSQLVPMFFGDKIKDYAPTEAEITKAETDILQQYASDYGTNITLSFSESNYLKGVFGGKNLETVYFKFNGIIHDYDDLSFEAYCERPTAQKSAECTVEKDLSTGLKWRIHDHLKQQLTEKAIAALQDAGIKAQPYQGACFSYYACVKLEETNPLNKETLNAILSTRSVAYDFTQENQARNESLKRINQSILGATILITDNYYLTIHEDKSVSLRRDTLGDEIRVDTADDILKIIDSYSQKQQ